MYKTIKKLEQQGLFNEALRNNLIPITVAGHKLIYEVYLKIRKEGFVKGYGKRQAVLLTSIDTNTAESTIYEIIKRMEA